MEMNVERKIAAPRDQVWSALNDIKVLQAAIPGCSSLEYDGENKFKAQITVKVGPVKAKFNFNVSLTDINEPQGYTINGEGQGGAAGFANGSAVVTLREDGSETILAYHARANVGGKLAQLGGRLIDATANKMADEFFVKFSELATNYHLGAAVLPKGDTGTGAEVKPGGNVWLWLAGITFLALLSGILLL